MRKILLLFIIVASAINPLLAQVGINTENPQAVLDVNGNLMIQSVPVDNTSTSILVLGTNNEVHRNTSLLAASPQTFVEGTGGTAVSLLDISLLTGWYKIQFPTKDFDEHADYNASTSEFTAPMAGVYNIYVQMATTSVVSAGEVGVGIFLKPFGGTGFTKIAEETYASINVSILTIDLDVSPPSRKTQRLVKLAKGDVIIFGAKVPLLSVTLIGGSKSFFAINQVK